MERWNTGGEEYLLIFRTGFGNHELLRVVDEESGECELVESGHREKCIAKMQEIKIGNIDYDYNL